MKYHWSWCYCCPPVVRWFRDDWGEKMRRWDFLCFPESHMRTVPGGKSVKRAQKRRCQVTKMNEAETSRLGREREAYFDITRNHHQKLRVMKSKNTLRHWISIYFKKKSRLVKKKSKCIIISRLLHSSWPSCLPSKRQISSLQVCDLQQARVGAKAGKVWEMDEPKRFKEEEKLEGEALKTWRRRRHRRTGNL